MKSVQELLSARTASSEEAEQAYKSLPPINATEVFGRWKGLGLSTGHPHDGMLEGSGWYGKEFTKREAHPLLYQSLAGEIFPIDPANMGPVLMRGGSILESQKEVQTNDHQARLRMVEDPHGVSTASMIYNHTPIIDHFRKVDNETLLGIMDNLEVPGPPFYFILHREK